MSQSNNVLRSYFEEYEMCSALNSSRRGVHQVLYQVIGVTCTAFEYLAVLVTMHSRYELEVAQWWDYTTESCRSFPG